MLSQKLKVIISGGGTGGHIFPAIAIADAISELVPDSEILFIGAEGRMEMEKVPNAGYKIEGLWISGLQRSLTLKNLSFPFKLIHSLRKAKRIIKEFNPDVAVGVGGYASGPTIRMASKLGIPTILQEQNSYPGITNKMLASKANFICVAYPDMEKYFPKEKLIITGNPVRKEIYQNSVDKKSALNYFKLDDSKPLILVVGGSLGALTLNESVANGLQSLEDNGVQVIWQTGKSYEATAQNLIQSANIKGIISTAFITRMDLAYDAADLVISRSGALAISELCLKAKPCILVPSPNVAEDHQTRNAMSLVTRNAAVIVSDAEARTQLINKAIKLAKDKNLQEQLSENIYKLAYKNSAKEIAQIIINCATSKLSLK